MLGFVTAALSPAVVIPSLKQLQDDGYGVAKGVPAMVLAAAALDINVAVTGFGVFFGIAFSSGGLGLAIAHGPIDIAIGAVGGAAAGGLLSLLRLTDAAPSRYAAALFATSACSVIGFGRIAHSGGGCLLAVCAAFVAKQLWPPAMTAAADALLKQLWDGAAKALLFGCIGAAVDVSFLSADLLGAAVVIVLCGLASRLPASMLATQGSPLTLRERLFVTLAWLPKATVQAALGPVALDRALARQPRDPLEVHWGEQVLCVTALAVLLTAPVGALLISLSGPRLLSRGDAAPAAGAASAVPAGDGCGKTEPPPPPSPPPAPAASLPPPVGGGDAESACG